MRRYSSGEGRAHTKTGGAEAARGTGGAQATQLMPLQAANAHQGIEAAAALT